MTKKILVATKNAGKLNEFNFLFESSQIKCNVFSFEILERVMSQPYREPKEPFDSFLMNALVKLQACAKYAVASGLEMTGYLIDDSGLCVPRLDFKPGVHSANLAGEPRSDKKNRDCLVEWIKHELRDETSDRVPAFFVSFLLLAETDELKNILAFDNFEKELEKNEEVFVKLEREILNQFSNLQTAKETCRVFKIPIYDISASFGVCHGYVGTHEYDFGFGHGYDSIFYTSENGNETFATIPLAEKSQRSHRANAIQGLLSDAGILKRHFHS